MRYARIIGLLVVATVVAGLGINPVAADASIPAGASGQVVNTNGDGLRMRAEPSVSAQTLRVLGETWLVTVTEGPFTGHDGNQWYQVRHTGATGYVGARFLVRANGESGVLPISSLAKVITDDGTSLRLRAEPHGGVVAVMPHESQVSVVGGPTTDANNDRWYQINYEGTTGWAMGAYLQPVPPSQASDERDATSRAGTRVAAAAAEPDPAPAPSAASRGQAVASLARELVGSPYAWGGTSPAGFDCSGFTRYVVLKTLGIDIGRDTFAQVGVGVPVAPSDLQPGDLVFQQNTYRWGLSHVGIYIGDGLMVSAQSESTGVRAQNIWDGYWGPRFHSARRLT